MAAASSNARTGGQILVDQLRIHGVERAFCVPGESYLAALDAFHDATDIQLVVCRQEGGVAMMAEATGKLTGRPGIGFVTRGPGATNASAGVHIAHQDSTPMVLFIGQVAREQMDREAFQEIDYRRMFGQMSKWVAQIERADRIPEYVSRAFYTATSGRPGPVVLALPEDMLVEQAYVSDAGPYRPHRAAPAPQDMREFQMMLSRAERPLAIVGGGDWDPAAVANFEQFARNFDLPVAAAFRSQSHFDNRLKEYVGDIGVGVNPKLAQRVRDADLILAIGARLGEATTGGYTLLEAPRPAQKLIHVYPDPEELGRVYQPDLPIAAGMGPFTSAAAQLEPVGEATWADWRAAARADYEEAIQPLPIPGDVQLAEIVCWLRNTLPDDTILTTGAGNYAGWVNKNYQFRQYRTLIGPTSGSMGYGVPAAVAAKIAYPSRTVISFAGDGCFLMNGQEFATAVMYDLPIIIMVVNNGVYGTIKMYQASAYPDRYPATSLVNPDFAALARAYGGHGETVTRTDEFQPAFERARASGKPAIIEIQVDPDAISPRTTITKLRDAAIDTG